MKTTHTFKILSLCIATLFLVNCGGVKEEKKENSEAGKPVNVEDVKATFMVTALTNHEYTFSGGGLEKAENPDITLKRGESYQFKVETFGHPFYIKTEQVIGPVKTYDKGVVENGTEYGTITFTVPKDAPDTLFYICKFHKMMTGKLIITD